MTFYVNVPNVLGVPPVAFAPSFAEPASNELLTTDTYSYFDGVFGPQWGIFLGGFPIITADTVTSLDYRQEWVISDYQIEEGGFEDYDKVATPFEGRVRFVAGGSFANREALLQSVAAIAPDTNLYDLVMPENVYPNVNIRHYDFRRTTESGRGVMIVDVSCEEIRVQTTGLSPTSAPSGASPAQGGTVQPSSGAPAPSGAPS